MSNRSEFSVWLCDLSFCTDETEGHRGYMFRRRRPTMRSLIPMSRTSQRITTPWLILIDLWMIDHCLMQALWPVWTNVRHVVATVACGRDFEWVQHDFRGPFTVYSFAHSHNSGQHPVTIESAAREMENTPFKDHVMTPLFALGGCQASSISLPWPCTPIKEHKRNPLHRRNRYRILNFRLPALATFHHRDAANHTVQKS